MKFATLAAALVFAFSGSAFAQDVQDHAAHHPDAATTAPAPAAPQAAAPTQGQTNSQVPGMMMRCPMMNGAGNAAAKPDAAKPGPQMGMANGAMGCPMMQGQGGMMMQGQDRAAAPQAPAKGS